MNIEERHLVKVASKSVVSKVAGAIAGLIRDGKEVDVQAIGAGAINQAVKSIALASLYLMENNIFITTLPEVVHLENVRGADFGYVSLVAGIKFPLTIKES